MGNNTKEGTPKTDGVTYGHTINKIVVGGNTYTTKGEKMMVNGNLMTIYYKTPGIFNEVYACPNPTEENDNNVELLKVKTVGGTTVVEHQETNPDSGGDGGNGKKKPEVGKITYKAASSAKGGTKGDGEPEAQPTVDLELETAIEDGVNLGDLVYTDGGAVIVNAADWTMVDETNYTATTSEEINDLPVSVTLECTVDGQEDASDPVMMAEWEDEPVGE